MKQYLDMVRHVLQNGTRKDGRNGGTISVFGYHYEHDLARGFPLLTTKKVFWRGVVGELIWYLSGEAHIRNLQAKGLQFWDEWADDRGNVSSPYGWFWRNWGSQHADGPPFRSLAPTIAGEGVDQIELVLNELRTDPNSRRMVLTAWDPVNAWSSGLPPCHDFTVFNVQNGRLCAHLTQRSGDIALGIPFNLACYSALIHLMAHLSGLEVGIFSHTIVDAHIYANHEAGLREQLSRQPRALPSLSIAAHVDSPDNLMAGDFILEGYNPHPAISFEVSV